MIFQPVLYVIGYLLSALSIILCIPAAVDAFYGDNQWQSFTFASLISLFFGIILILGNKSDNFSISLKQAFLVTTLSWIFVAFFGSLPFVFSDLGLSFTDAFFESCSNNKRLYERSNKTFNEMVELSKYEKDIPIDSKLRDDYPMERELEGAIILCEKTVEKINKHLYLLKDNINSIKSLNISPFLELSIKHKPIYYNSNNNEEVPNNIHKIFSNYIHIHNLFIKQLIIYYNNLSSIVEEIQKNYAELQLLKKNVKIIAHLDTSDESLLDIVFKGIQDIFSSDDDKESENNQINENENENENEEKKILIMDEESTSDEEEFQPEFKNNNINNAENLSKKLTNFF